MFSLTIVRPDGREIDQTFRVDRAVIGRDENCELRLLDGMVSRNHCSIYKEGKKYIVDDLDSRNGTWVNGMRIERGRQVKEGDIIQIGPFRLLFSPGQSKRGVDAAKAATTLLERNDFQPYQHKQDAERVVKPLGIISSYLSQEPYKIPKESTGVRRERLNRNLLTLYRMAEDLVGMQDIEETLDYIMDQLFEIFEPSQASILVRERDEFPLPKRERCAEDRCRHRSVSSTIVQRILDDRVAMITDNALEDPRFLMGDSIIIDGIRSVMAAPIWEDRAILGVLYVDSLDKVGGYKAEDLDLLTAMGHQTALALQRAKLTEKLRHEAIKSAVMRKNLERFHSPPVVDLILNGQADQSVKEAEITVLICDIVSSTSLCQSADPSGLQTVLRVFSEVVNEAVFREQGTLDKFIGDAAMCIFGAPLPQEDASVRAIRSALHIQQELGRAMNTLNRSLRFRVRYGINTGIAVAGNFGSEDRMEYTVLGTAVNQAFRICDLAQPNQILIGENTHDQIDGRNLFLCKEVGVKRLKGIKGSVKLFQVLGSAERSLLNHDK